MGKVKVFCKSSESWYSSGNYFEDSIFDRHFRLLLILFCRPSPPATTPEATAPDKKNVFQIPDHLAVPPVHAFGSRHPGPVNGLELLPDFLLPHLGVFDNEVAHLYSAFFIPGF
jgi:hypothetical protein